MDFVTGQLPGCDTSLVDTLNHLGALGCKGHWRHRVQWSQDAKWCRSLWKHWRARVTGDIGYKGHSMHRDAKITGTTGVQGSQKPQTTRVTGFTGVQKSQDYRATQNTGVKGKTKYTGYTSQGGSVAIEKTQC